MESHPPGRGGHCERRVFCSVAEDGVSDVDSKGTKTRFFRSKSAKKSHFVRIFVGTIYSLSCFFFNNSFCDMLFHFLETTVHIDYDYAIDG